MPALNFQKQFSAAVESGDKRQTIRLVRKHPINPGDTLYLYTGMRTKACRRLGEVRCKSVTPIELSRKRWGATGVASSVKGSPCSPDRLAKLDGFDGFGKMVDWFEKTHGLPFGGVLIRW